MASLAGTPGLIIAAGVGAAASTALEPAFEAPRQDAWARNPNRIIGLDTLARLVASGGVELGSSDGGSSGTAYEEARRQGFTSDKLDRLIYLAQRVPSISEARALRRRRGDDNSTPLITSAQLHRVYAKEAIDPQYWPALDALVQDILSPGELAAAIHRGLVPDPGLLQGQQPEPPFKVEAYPVYPIDALAEALGTGYDRDRLGVLVGLQGLPMGTHEAAQALFRGIITHGDYVRAFNESNSRNEWAQAVLEYTRQIPTARDFFENALRGYHNLAWAQEQAQRHGMTEADSLVIYQNQGRPMAVSNIQKALARGGTFKPEPGELKDPFEASIVEGNLKPAYYDLAKQLRYTMPSAFVMRQLAESGVWNEAKTAERLKWLGWFPEDADEAAAAWTKQGAASGSPFVGRAQTQLWTALHKAFVKGGTMDAATADSFLTNLVPGAGDRAEIIQLWETERNIDALPRSPA